MKIHILQFDERVTAGSYGDWLRDWGHDCRIWRGDRGELPILGAEEPLLLLGGYMGLSERERYPFLGQAQQWLPALVAQGQPLLAICLGSQLLAAALGGQVTARQRGERGIQPVGLTDAGRQDRLFAGLPDPFLSFHWHTDSFELPPAAVHLAATDHCPGQAFRLKHAYGIQFHPEVDERIVADWCRRTGTGDWPLKQWLKHQMAYRAASRTLLQNFLATVSVPCG